MQGIVFQIGDQRAKIAKRLFEFRLGQDYSDSQPFFNPVYEGVDDRNSLGLAQLESLKRGKRPSDIFERK